MRTGMGTLPLQLHLERQLHPKSTPGPGSIEPDPPAKVLAPLPDVEEPKGGSVLTPRPSTARGQATPFVR